MSKRPALGLVATSMHSSNPDYVHVNWKQDKALESNEGGVIRILYEAKNLTAFQVQSRVKGTSEGFTKHSKGSVLALPRSVAWGFVAVGLLFIAWGVFTVWPSDRPVRKTWERTHQFSSADEYLQNWKKSPSNRWMTPVFLVIFCCLGGWIIWIGYSGLRYPSWASDVINSASILR